MYSFFSNYQIESIESTGKSNLNLPFSSINSTTVNKPEIFLPLLLIILATQSTVPPVARRSSTIAYELNFCRASFTKENDSEKKLTILSKDSVANVCNPLHAVVTFSCAQPKPDEKKPLTLSYAFPAKFCKPSHVDTTKSFDQENAPVKKPVIPSKIP